MNIKLHFVLNGLFELLVMNFRLTNTLPTFQCFMNKIFHDLLDISIVIYLDDIIVYTKGNLDTHHKQVVEVLQQL